MKFAVQPYGATMQAPAPKPAATPGQSVFRYSSATWTPSAPAWWTCAASVGVNHAGDGRFGVEVCAEAAAAAASPPHSPSTMATSTALARTVFLPLSDAASRPTGYRATACTKLP